MKYHEILSYYYSKEKRKKISSFKTENLSLDQFDHLSDGQIATDDGYKFKVHRVLLSSISPFFHTVFCLTSTGIEKGQCNLTGISGDVVKKIIQYSFSRNLKITKENVLELLIASDFFMIDDLVRKCVNFVRSNLTLANCLDIFNVSLLLNHLYLFELCFRFITVYFENIVKKETCAFANLDADDLFKLLSNQDLNVSDELIVWNVLDTWLRNDLQNRTPALPCLLGALKLTKEEIKNITNAFSLNMSSIHSAVRLFRRPQPAVAAYFICTNLIFKNNCYITYDEKFDFWRRVISVHHTPYSIMCGTNACIYFMNHNNISLLDMAQGTFIELAEFRISRMDYGSAVIRDRLYIIGGKIHFPRFTRYKSVDCFDLYARRWLWVQPTEYPCHGPVAVVRNKIYAFGSRFDVEMQGTVLSGECYDPITNTWTLLKPLQAPFKNHFAVFAMQDRVYVCGKREKRVYFTCYDTVAKLWVHDNASNVLHSYFKNPEICRLFDTVVIYEASEKLKHPKSYIWDPSVCKWKVPKENILKDLRNYHIICIRDKESLEKLRDRSTYQWKRFEFN